MTKVKIIKRNPAKINVSSDFNPTVFRYFVGNLEVKQAKVRDGVKPAFLGFLDELILPDPTNYSEYSDWVFSDPIPATSQTGSTSTIINTYSGIRYVYKPELTTIITPALPALRGEYTGQLYYYAISIMGEIITPTSDLNIATHSLLQDGTYDTLEAWGGRSATRAVTSTRPQGYYPVETSEVGTHGKEGAAFRPLSYWDETVVSDAPGSEYTGKITEQFTGFSINLASIGMNTTSSGEALSRYTPNNLKTYASLIKMEYYSRNSQNFEGDI